MVLPFAMLKIITGVLLSLLSSATMAARCFCTDEHCVPYGICEASVCLVGLLRSTNAVIRTCGTEPVGCQRNVDKWSYLCGCEESFCNTLSFLRATASGLQADRSSRVINHDDMGDEDRRVFQRVDPPLGDFSHFGSNSDDDNFPFITYSSQLTLVIILVPLSIGAAVVLVMSFNSYYHLC